MGLKPFRVGQVNNYIGRILKTDPILGNISVIGEISNLTFHKSGYVFFSLKEDKSKLKCIISPWNVEKITCPLEEGMEIIASGYISVFERDGVYNLNVRDIETNGIGQLAVAFEKLNAPAAQVIVNGALAGNMLFSPFVVDVTDYLVDGENEIIINMLSGNRNLLGPHHRPYGESYYVGPDTFSSKNGWSDDPKLPPWTDNYNFVLFGAEL